MALNDLPLCAGEIDDAQEAFNFIDKDGGESICESEAREYYTAKYDKDVKNNMRTRMNAQAVTPLHALWRTVCCLHRLVVLVYPLLNCLFSAAASFSRCDMSNLLDPVQLFFLLI